MLQGGKVRGMAHVSIVLASQSPARRSTLQAAGIWPQVIVSGVDEDQALAQAQARFGSLDVADAALVLAKAKAEAVAQLIENDGLDGDSAQSDSAQSDSAEGDSPDTGEKDIEGDIEGQDGLAEASGSTAQVDLDNCLVVGCDSLLEFPAPGPASAGREGAGNIGRAGSPENAGESQGQAMDRAMGKPATAQIAIDRWKAMRGKTGILHTGHWIIDLRDTDQGGTGATLGATSSTTVHFAMIDDAEIEAYVATGEPLQVAGGFTVDGLGGPYVDGIEGDYHSVVGISLPLLRQLCEQLDIPFSALRNSAH